MAKAIKSVKDAESTILCCSNGHPLWIVVEKGGSEVYYEQEEGVTGRLYRAKHSRDTKPEISVMCDTGTCKVGRYEDREMRRMFEGTPK